MSATLAAYSAKLTGKTLFARPRSAKPCVRLMTPSMTFRYQKAMPKRISLSVTGNAKTLTSVDVLVQRMGKMAKRRSVMARSETHGKR